MLRAPIIIWLGGAFAIVSVGTSTLTSIARAESVPEGNVLVISKTSGSAGSPLRTEPRASSAYGRVSQPANEGTNAQSAPPASKSDTQPSAAPSENTPKHLAKAERQPRDRTMSLELPLKFQSFYLGDFPVKLSASGALSIKVDALARPLKKVMKPEAITTVLSARTSTASDDPSLAGSGGLTEIAKTGAVAESRWAFLPASLFHGGRGENGAPPAAANHTDTPPFSGYLPIEEIKKHGLDLRYDPLQSEILVSLSIDQKLDSNVSFGGPQEIAISANSQTPAFFSAYLNARMLTTYVGQSASANTGLNAPNFDFDNAIRAGPIVMENELTLTPSNGPQQGENGTAGYEIVRRGSRLIYDSPADIVRYKAGDLSPAYAGFQTSPDILGMSAERSYAQLRPGENIRPTGHHTFKLERPSNVDILTDGVIIRRLHLQAGNYNLSDLPVNPGANKVTLLIEDDTGERRTLEFNQFSGQDLLARGLSEWQFAAGVQALRSPANPGVSPLLLAYHEPEYLWEEPVLTGFYRTGLTPAMTAGIDAQADSRVAMGGGSLSMQTAYGFVAIDLSGSFGPAIGAGFAGRAAYELINIRDGGGLSQSFRLAAEYQSAAFTTVGGYVPPQNHAASLSALYTRAFTEDLSASLSGTLYLSGEMLLTPPSSWDTDFTVSERLSPSLSGSCAWQRRFLRLSVLSQPTRSPCLCPSRLPARSSLDLISIARHERPDGARDIHSQREQWGQ